MIIVVDGKSYKKLALKAFSYLGLLLMFYFYYNHMSDRFKNTNEALVKKLDIKSENKQKLLSKTLEKLIYKESETIVDLLGQNKIQSIKIVEDKLYIVCDFNTDIEPLIIRYGVNSMIKQTAANIKIAINLKFIVESRYET